MNSRERRKIAAIEHNERISLIDRIHNLQSAIRAKHGVSVRAVIDSTNSSALKEIDRLSAILECETPPTRKRVATISPFIAAMAAIGVESFGVISGSRK